MVFVFIQRYDQVSVTFVFLTVISVRVWKNCLEAQKEVSQEKLIVLTKAFVHLVSESNHEYPYYKDNCLPFLNVLLL